MSNAIVLREATADLRVVRPEDAVAARNPEDLFRYAQWAAKIGFCGVKSPEEACVRMATGMEAGLRPWASLRGVYVFNGRPSLYAEQLVAACVGKPDLCEYFILTESTEERATYTTRRRGAPEPVTMSFSADDAKRARLWGKPGPWTEHPRAMLRARAKTILAREVYPDLLAGIYSPDEISEFDPAAARQVQAEESHPAPAVADAEHPVDLEPWVARFAAAATVAELTAIGRELGQNGTSRLRQELSGAFVRRREELKAAAREPPPVNDAEPEARADFE